MSEVNIKEEIIKKPKTPSMADGGKFKYGLTASNIQGQLEQLNSRKGQLKATTKSTAEGKNDHLEEIFRLKQRRELLQARMNKNKAWIDVYEKEIGPFESKYSGLVEEIHGIYGEAKEKHALGVEFLIKEFNYHPIFKHYNDDFTSVPFKPK
mmetsp:Transcript_21990/g.30540  ORF Transcript_21990/g.30540 Transcript_21990/m.30540 type:complete len:152 (-) Transcript_21990:92-547(-)|eukprot:CAMPEP_0196592434 /NCGR_PEP_ID=MMETSP1081-20130531/72762_1 /TAXON_ID=36882 /ORGANISM="Pyramimonas amylifera, Strain CCMP720" /LENGTH=151 /DNA_ID=CAMNT_0041916135 /DNA_START=362 /DNA_END=817 /DNA_ORIENTATION=-